MISNKAILRTVAVLCIFVMILATWSNQGMLMKNGTIHKNGSGKKAGPGRTIQEAKNYNTGEFDNVVEDDIVLPESEVLMFENITAHNFREKQLEEYWSAKNQLIPGAVPPNVHFLWCGNRWFVFKQYLSVQSVIQAIKPDRIVIHYEQDIQIDKIYYHQWLMNLKNDFPFLHMKRMDGDLPRFCSSNNPAFQTEVILKLLDAEGGGLYVGENTFLMKYAPTERLVNLDFALEMGGLDGYVMLRQGALQKDVHFQDLLKNETTMYKTSSCSTVSQLYNGNDKAKCYIVKGGNFDSFNPMNIWELENAFGRLCRKIFYGTEKIIRPEPSYDELVPNIGHMIWIGGGPMDFVFYLSVLSLIYVVEVEVVYIHGDKEPAGVYWPRLRNHPKVKFITRLEPLGIYQGVVEPWYRSLMSDLIRVDLMIKYGGIYADTDAIWVKPISYEDRGYDAVASFDWIDWSWPFPDSVNFGLSYGKKNAPFWRVFRDSMRILHNDSPGYTGVQMPYKLLEKYPHLLRIDRHLQVICYQSKCHPTWIKDYHNESRHHLSEDSIPNWKEDVNAFHWTHPNPVELTDEVTLRNSTGVFAELGKFVLEKAGLWNP